MNWRHYLIWEKIEPACSSEIRVSHFSWHGRANTSPRAYFGNQLFAKGKYNPLIQLTWLSFECIRSVYPGRIFFLRFTSSSAICAAGWQAWNPCSRFNTHILLTSPVVSILDIFQHAQIVRGFAFNFRLSAGALLGKWKMLSNSLFAM